MSWETAAVMVVIMVAGMIQGLSGFAFGMVAIALLSWIIDLKDASIILAWPSLAINLFILWRLRCHFRLERITPLLLSAVIGAPLGIFFLVHSDPVCFRRVLGVILLAAVVQRFLPLLKGKAWHPLWLGIPAGLLSGAMSGAFASGGPPVVAYFSSQNFVHARFVASVQAGLAAGTAARLLVLMTGHKFAGVNLMLGGAGVIMAVLGAGVGLLLLPRLNRKVSRAITFTLLVVMALKFTLW
ncbi:MAG: sulfite exporter TauE/SafE family protein [Victivallales bacterium]|nr:sulfite exporter TauE/SafE family protein [Victivallales bacterium]